MIDTKRLREDQYRKKHRDELGDLGYRNAVIKKLLHEYKDGIYRYCVSRTDEINGEEIAEEVFISAWINLHTYKGQSSIKDWLYGIARNQCNKFLSKRDRRKELTEKWIQDIRERAHTEKPTLPDEELERDKMIEKLIAAIEQLSYEDRLLVKLSYFDQNEMTVEEISELLEEKPNTIYKRRKRILKKLARCMKNES